MTLIVLFLFRVVSGFFFHLLYLKIESCYVIFMQKKKFLGEFYLLKEFICNETQNGPENTLTGNRRNTLSPKTNIKREFVICFRFVNIKVSWNLRKRKLFGLSVEACVAERLTLWNFDLEVRGVSLACGVVFLDKELYSTLSFFTHVYKWIPGIHCWV